ncbi:MAG TPA: LacI family DNA-binding transcriptional regulator [Bryobacteraceae bacterium]|nr:LacI family DNA-binding transcriptional regulator [Bryobacteraceae bacterium]
MNLEEVAKRAGVSTATVSRVLNQADVVRSSTRLRVMRAVSELNYHPNLHARSLAKGASRTIGMIASNLQNPFFFDIFRALEADAHVHGFEVVAANTDYELGNLVRSVRLMIGRRVAGLAVIVSEMNKELIDELAGSKLRVVFYDVGTSGRTMSNIRVNYRRGIERVVEYLHNLNHRRLAFVGHHAALGPLSEREKAFVETVSRYSPDTEWRTLTTHDALEGGQQAAREILSSGFHPTAIICVNDIMAVGVLREVRERGLRIPQDISVTGFDNIKLSEFAYPSLTTLHIPRDRIGHLAFGMLVPESARGKAPGREIVIDPELVLRDSTGPASVARATA